MKSLFKFVFLVLFTNNPGFGLNPCSPRQIPGADSVCVCNQTYCDDFPPLKRPDVGTARLYESGKSGNRFKESKVKVETISKNKSNETLTITIDKSKTYQNILGFGGAFTDVTGFVLSAVPKSLSDRLMNSYFSDNGIQYNMARVPIAGTDYSFREYSYDDTKDDKDDMKLEHFALQDEDFKYKLPFIKHAQNLSTNLRLFASPWHCPQWMKTDENSKEPAQLKSEIGGEYYDIWARYFIKFLDAYKAQNVSFWGLTVENEPTWGRVFNSLYLDAVMEREFVKKNLGPHLHQSGYTPDKLKLMIYDDNVNYIDGRPSIQNYTDTILGDDEAKKYVSGIAYHWYENSRDSEYPDEILDKVHDNFPDHFTLMTEAFEGFECRHLDHFGQGRWEFAEHYAHDIIRDLNHWAKGWIEWNMAVGLNGYSNIDILHCGSSLLIDIEKKEAYKQPSFYAIGHFSKFVSSDSVRVEHKITQNIEGVFVLTVKRPDNGMVAVVLNQNNRSINLQINDSNNFIFNAIPDRSIQTYIWY